MGWSAGTDRLFNIMVGEFEMKVRVTDLAGAHRLLEDVSWTLSGYGNVEVRGESVILSNGSTVMCKTNLVIDDFEIEFWAEPNIGINRVPIYLYPRYLSLKTIEELKNLLVAIFLEVRDGIFIMATLASIGLLSNPRHVAITINIDRNGGKYKPMSQKVIVDAKGIGYEIVTAGRSRTYKISLPNFNLFKAFVEVVLPEFLESREVSE